MVPFSSGWLFELFGSGYGIMLVAATLVIGAVLHWIFFVPLNRVRDLTDVGYGHLKDEAQKRGLQIRDLANEIRAQKKIGNIPPVYPNGWFAVMESRDLKKGVSKPATAVGENFVVFRSEGGVAHVLDAYCPHVGAHLGVGGRVIDNCIECPFHGWRFSGEDGKCTLIPYSDKVPNFAKVKKWQSWEGNGFIFIWFHAEKEKPNWFPTEVKEITSKQWIYSGRTEHHVNSHIQDVPENGSDIYHLAQVHGPAMMAGADLRFYRTRLWEFLEHIWEGGWTECPAPNSHMAIVKITHSMRLCGKIPLLDINVDAKQIGPSLVHLELETAFGKGVLVQAVTPVAPLHLRIVHHFYAARYMPTFYSKIILYGEAIMLERDVMVWNHKTFVSKPLFIREDRLMSQYRRWYSQFYSENSPRLGLMKNTLEW